MTNMTFSGIYGSAIYSYPSMTINKLVYKTQILRLRAGTIDITVDCLKSLIKLQKSYGCLTLGDVYDNLTKTFKQGVIYAY